MMDRDQPNFPAWCVRLLLIALLCVGGGTAISLFAEGGTSDLAAPAVQPMFSPEEQGYVNTIGVRILAMNREIQTISELVATRSRNVFELNRRGSRVETLAAEIDTFRRESPVPARFVTLDTEAQSATALALDAISQARSALSSFDFSGIANLIPSFDEAAATMDSAASSLESMIRTATPVVGRTSDPKGTSHAIHGHVSPRWRIPRGDH